MPRFKTGKRKKDQSQTIVGRIKGRIEDGKVIPLISNVATSDLVLGGHDRLVKAYAKHIETPPLYQQHNLLQMAQFKIVTDDSISDSWALKKDYMNFIKNELFNIAVADKVSPTVRDEVEAQFDDITFSEFSKQLGYPRFDREKADPLLILADLPISIFLTTSYHGFVEAALHEADKSPRTGICRWRTGSENIPSGFEEGYEPCESEPLVYHLHGFDEYPDSLVLTEDDYLEFLVAISGNASTPNDPIHKRVRGAISQSSLVLLGYGLRSWDFRTLFWGLIKPRPTKDYLSFAIQLEDNEVEKNYLQKYMREVKFEVYWGDIHKLTRELA